MRLPILMLTGIAAIAGGAGWTSAEPRAAPADAAAVPAPSPDVAAAETARVNEWFARRFAESLAFSPMARTSLGDRTDYDKIDDMSEEAQDREMEWRRKTVEDLKVGFDRSKLTSQGKISYDLWIDQYERAADAVRFRGHDYIFTQIQGPQTTLAQFLIVSHRVDGPSDMDAYIARIGGISRAIGQLLARAKRNAAAGTRPPSFAYEGVIAQARALISGAPFAGEGDSPIWADARTKIDALAAAGKIDTARADTLKVGAKAALLEKWGPACRALIDWAEADKANSATNATGVGGSPGGNAYYAMRLRNMTTTDLTPDEIHRFGLEDMARIHREMETIKTKLAFNGSLQEFFRFIREDPQFYYPNTDAGRQAYLDAANAALARIKTKLPDYFGILPKADLVVKRVEPFREEAGAVQHYYAGAPDGSRPGVFYVHMLDMRSLPIPQLEVAAYHEGLPGHHMQISIAQELTDAPKFRSRALFAAYLEGWGLYSELLAKEMGAYQNPYSDFGRLTLEAWRAARLVVDTGLHSNAWTEADAIAYMHENVPLADGQIRTEVRRYLVQPGVATAYKIGMRKILELRERARTELGEKFDIRGFHDAVLGGGALPLDMLERVIDEWIDTQRIAARDGRQK